jgi:hypothetical protein
VFFDANSSGTCTIAAGNTGAKSINCTGFTGGIAGTAAITVAGSITLDAGQTYTHIGTVTITGTGTLTTASKAFSAVRVNGSGITVTLGDALNTSPRLVDVTQGTFDTAGYNVTSGSFISDSTSARTVNFNSSTVSTPSSTGLDFDPSTNLTFNAGTSQINFTGSTSGLQGGSGQNFYNVSFTSAVTGTRTITGANTFNNLTLNASATGLSQLQLSDDQTVNGTFTCAGSSAIARGFVRSNVIGTTRTITAAAVSADDCDFRDITIAGAAAPIAPTRAGDCGGNSGITFPAAKSAFRVGTGTIWGTTGAAWALTSGGTGSADNFPLPQDTAVIDDNTALTGTLGLGAYNIGSLDASARTTGITLNHNATATRYGDYTLGSGVTVSGTSIQTFSGRGTQTFTSAGKTITFPITVDKPTGAFELGDAFESSNTVTHTRGTLDAKNYNVTCTTFTVSNNTNVRTLTMGSGLWTLSGTGNVWVISTNQQNLTFNKDTADILLSNTTTAARTFLGGNNTYNKLTIGGATGTSITGITGSNTFSELAASKTVAHTITFNTSNQTIDTWSVTGTSGNVVTVNSSLAGTRRTINLTNATSDIDFLDVKDIGITDPDKFYVGDNSTDSGNNLNVIFTAAPGGTVDLTGDGITAGAPTVGASAIAQGHVLAADGLTTGSPVIQSSTIVQEHVLAADGITTGNPVVVASDIAQGHDLAPTTITTGSPVVGEATAIEATFLLADGITTGQPTVGSPNITQDHSLILAAIVTGQPTVGSPDAVITSVLLADGITTGQPVVGSPDAAITSVLVADDITTGQPTVGSADAVTTSVLVADDITTGQPAVGSSDVVITNVLVADDITTGQPTVGSSNAVTTSVLVADDITTGQPVVEPSDAVTTSVLLGNDITTGAPSVAGITMSEDETFNAPPIVTGPPVVEASTIAQEHILSLVGIVVGQPVVGSALITQEHTLVAANITTAPATVGLSSLEAFANLLADSITTGQPVVEASDFDQEHILLGENVTTGQPVLNTSTITQDHNLTLDGIITDQPTVEPSVCVINIVMLGSNVVTGQPTLGSPSILTFGRRVVSITDDSTNNATISEAKNYAHIDNKHNRVA